MTLKLSTGLRSGTLSTGSVKSLLDGGFIDIYRGEVPNTADDALGSAELMCRISVDGLGAGLTLSPTATNAVLTKVAEEVWIGEKLLTGTPTFFRFVAAADDGTASQTAPRIQGRVGLAGAQMNLSNINFIVGATQTIDHFAFAIPAGDTLKTSTALRNAALVTGSVKSVMDGGFIDIYAGAVPATADASVGGATKLCRISLASSTTGINFDTDAIEGVILKAPAEVWSGVNLATGTATFYRFVKVEDDGFASTTAPRIQGSVGVVGADLNLSSTELVLGATQSVDNYAFAWPTL